MIMTIILAAALTQTKPAIVSKYEVKTIEVLTPVVPYIANEGDVIVLYSRNKNSNELQNTMVLANYDAWMELSRFAKARDLTGLQDLVKSKNAAMLTSGTKVKITKINEPLSKLNHQQNVDNPIKDSNFWIVRIQDGAFAGREVYINPGSATKCEIIKKKVRVKKSTTIPNTPTTGVPD